MYKLLIVCGVLFLVGNGGSSASANANWGWIMCGAYTEEELTEWDAEGVLISSRVFSVSDDDPAYLSYLLGRYEGQSDNSEAKKLLKAYIGNAEIISSFIYDEYGVEFEDREFIVNEEIRACGAEAEIYFSHGNRVYVGLANARTIKTRESAARTRDEIISEFAYEGVPFAEVNFPEE